MHEAAKILVTRHRPKQLQGKLPFFLAAADGGVVGDDVGRKFGTRHGTEELQCPLPCPGLLTGADCGIVADDVGA